MSKNTTALANRFNFRAWDKNGKWMSYGVRENYDDMIAWRFRHWEPETDNGKDLDDVVLMQSTGLKDKNGKEIYEGDVLQGEYGEQSKEPLEKIVGQVRFESGCFVIVFPWFRKKLYDIDGNHAIYWRDRGNHMVGAEWFYRIENIHVIGNIYEHPSLLP